MNCDTVKQGYDAYRMGYGSGKNPYCPSSKKYSLWLDGWNAAKDEDC